MRVVLSWWYWCERWWRIPLTAETDWSRQKAVAWILAVVSLVLAFSASYYASRLRLLTLKQMAVESEIYE